MTVELFDEMQVRCVLKRAVVEAGGVLLFASKYKLRPRDIDLVTQGFIAPSNRLLKSIGYVRCVRYAKESG